MLPLWTQMDSTDGSVACALSEVQKPVLENAPPRGFDSWREYHADKKRRRFEAEHKRKDWIIRRSVVMRASTFYARLKQQGMTCGICGRPFRRNSDIQTDHDHVTGRARGFLCRKCNLGLGMFDDDIGVLDSAISYLVRHNALLTKMERRTYREMHRVTGRALRRRWLGEEGP